MLLLLSQGRSCFISYPYKPRYTALFSKVVVPTHRRHGWTTIDTRTMSPGPRIHDQIVLAIRECDLFVCEVSDANPNVCYELGLANAWGKTCIVLSHALEKAPFDVTSKYPALPYTPDPQGQEFLGKQLDTALRRFAEKRRTLADPGLWRYVDPQASISVEVLSGFSGPLEVFDYGHRVLRALQGIEALPESRLQEIRIGSFGAWISANLESVTRLLEKIVFFIPEWKKKGAERLKIEAEAEKLQAEADYVRAQSEEARAETQRKNVDALLEIVASARDMGTTRLTIGGRLSIESDKDGTIHVGLPPRTDDAEGSA